MRKQRTCILATLLWVSALCPAQQNLPTAPASCKEGATAAKPYAAEFASNKPFVQVRMNGSKPLQFVLDTGSPTAGLDTRLADSLGFHADGVLTRTGGAGQRGGVISRLSPRACEEMGGARLSNGFVISLDLSQVSSVEGKRVDGLLGGDFYSRYVVVIDYAHKSVEVQDPPLQYKGDGVILPITIKGNHMFSTVALRKPSGEMVQANLLIDTGVRVALLFNAPFSRESGILDRQSMIPQVTYGIGAGGETRGDMFRLSELQWGPLRFHDVVAFASTDTKGAFASRDFDGIIGADVLRRYKVFLDYPAKRIILEPTVAAREEFAYDESGLFLIAEGSDLSVIRVFRVLSTSPADLAGIRDGDELVSIDGKKAGRLGLEEVRQMFRADNRKYSLQLRRDRKLLPATLTTRDLLSTAAATRAAVKTAASKE